MMARCVRASILVIAFGLGGAHPVRAEDGAPNAAEAAKERFRQGAQAYTDGRFKDAIDLFHDADRLAPNPAFAYNIGLAYEELGDASNALRAYRAYLRDLPGAPDQADVEQRIVAAERHLAERGVQQVRVLSSPSGATVAIDGHRVGVAPWVTDLTPGKHQLGLELHGFMDSTSEFELPLEHAIDLVVVLKAEPQAAVVTRVAAPVAPEEDDRRSVAAKVHPVTWATLGVGIGALGAALGLELARASSVDAARGAPTNLVGKEDYDRARTYETAAKILVGAGGAVTALGGVLLYVDLSAPSSHGPKLGARIDCPAPSSGGCGVRFDGAF